MDKEAVARSRLTNLSTEESAIAVKYLAAQAAQQEKLNAAKAAEQQYSASGLPELKRAEQAYKQLTNAYRQHISAVKSGNEAEQAYWQQSAQAAMQELQSVENKLPSLNIEEDVRRKILALIHQAKTAESAHGKTVAGLNGEVNNLNKTLDHVGSRLIQMAATMLVLRG